jgi:peptidoglycan/LPS O-acetylase OafA/YrhL
LPSADSWRALATSALMVQNYVGTGEAGEGARQLATNWSLWSLPVEMELYLVYPLLLPLLRQWGAGVTLAATSLISLVAVLAGKTGWPSFAVFWGIWWGGVWLAERRRRGDLSPPPRALTALAWLALGAAVAMEATHRFGAWTHLAFGGFYFWAVWALLLWSPRGLRVGLRVSAALQWLGTCSYSFYLLHFPLFYLLGAAWLGYFGEKPHSLLVPLAAVAVILPAVAGFYRWIERPSHGWARRIAHAP